MRKLHPGQESTAGNVRLADRKIEVVTSLKGLPHYKEHTGWAWPRTTSCCSVVTENSVRSENTGVPTIREIMVATTMSTLCVAFFALITSNFRNLYPKEGDGQVDSKALEDLQIQIDDYIIQFINFIKNNRGKTWLRLEPS